MRVVVVAEVPAMVGATMVLAGPVRGMAACSGVEVKVEGEMEVAMVAAAKAVVAREVAAMGWAATAAVALGEVARAVVMVVAPKVVAKVAG